MLLGKPIEYWVDVQARIDELNLSSLMDEVHALSQEVTKLRGKVSFYESRVKQMHSICSRKEDGKLTN
jgi:hypothetical protein